MKTKLKAVVLLSSFWCKCVPRGSSSEVSGGSACFFSAVICYNLLNRFSSVMELCLKYPYSPKVLHSV